MNIHNIVYLVHKNFHLIVHINGARTQPRQTPPGQDATRTDTSRTGTYPGQDTTRTGCNLDRRNLDRHNPHRDTTRTGHNPDRDTTRIGTQPGDGQTVYLTRTPTK